MLKVTFENNSCITYQSIQQAMNIELAATFKKLPEDINAMKHCRKQLPRKDLGTKQHKSVIVPKNFHNISF